MAVVEPESPAQLAGAVDLALAHRGPLYLRMKRPDGPLPADFAPRPIRLGKLEMRREGRDGAIVASGMMVGLALAAAAELAHDGLQVGVVNMATIKPLDPDLADLAREAGTIVTAENHSIIGGLGSAVAELLLEAGVRVNFERVGIRDRFAEGGSTPYLFEKYGISAASIAAGFRKAKAKGR
jgi:transketolase